MLATTAHAKINLALHVTGQRDDGYHLLDSLVVFTEFGDRVIVEEGEAGGDYITLNTTGPFARGLPTDDRNLVMKAAILLSEAAFHKKVQTCPVSITLEKFLPVASGIGGGSADAAATLLALRNFWGLGDVVDLFEIGNVLSADVAMCFHSTPLLAQGIGDEITSLHMFSPLNLVLVNPLAEVSTPRVFSMLQAKNNPGIDMPQAEQIEQLDMFPSINAIKGMRNDLEQPALMAEPKIEQVMNVLHSSGSKLTRMSGSGATCFGVFDTPEITLHVSNMINNERPEWWCIATSTLTE